MDVVILLVFISLMLVAAGLAFFFYRLREGDFDHGERLSLAPLADDGPASSATAPRTSESNRTDRDSSSHRNNRTIEQPQGGDQHASC